MIEALKVSEVVLELIASMSHFWRFELFVLVVHESLFAGSNCFRILFSLHYILLATET